ncbi:GPP34 family phosphoprotein [bacterium]|nr:GPP34 family phosphoprotein [bacterium]
MLSLPEKLFLLSLDDQKEVHFSVSWAVLSVSIAGALVMELALRGKIHIDASQRITLIETTSCGDELLDDVLKSLLKKRTNQTMNLWVSTLLEKFSKLKIKERLLQNLNRKGVLQREEKLLFGVVPYNRYSLGGKTVRDNIQHELQSVIEKTKAPDESNVMLLSLLQSCHLYHRICPSVQESMVPRSRREYEEMLASA